MDSLDDQAVPGTIRRGRPLALIAVADALQWDADIVGKLEAFAAAIEAANEIAEDQVGIEAVALDDRVTVSANDELLVFPQDRPERKLVGDTA